MENVLEKVLYILSLSDFHENMSLRGIRRLIIPPLKLEQYRVYEDQDVPLCFVSWGMFSDIASEGYRTGVRKIQGDDWNSGNNFWIVDVACPFGGAFKAMKRIDKVRKNLNLPSKVNFLRGKQKRFGNVQRI